MKTIVLYGLAQPALIVPCASGVFYRQQCGGTMCLQRELEGVLVPFDDDPPLDDQQDSLLPRLMTLFSDGTGIIDRSMAERTQELLDSSPLTWDIRIDFSRISESEAIWVPAESPISVESWVHVKVSGDMADLMSGFGTTDAVLTWPNSD